MSEPRAEHLQPMEVAAYVDGVASTDVRARIQSHVAECAECRDEIVDAARIVAATSRRKFLIPRVWIPLAAAAALLLLVRPQIMRETTVVHREAPVTATVAPRAIAPVGPVDSAAALIWSSVPLSDHYRVRVFDGEGFVVWERETTDTSANLPATVPLVPARPYFWKVEAQTGFNRSAATELIEFSVRHRRAP